MMRLGLSGVEAGDDVGHRHRPSRGALDPALGLDGLELGLGELRRDVIDGLLVPDRLHRARCEFQELHDDVERALAAPLAGLDLIGLYLGPCRQREQGKRGHYRWFQESEAGGGRRHEVSRLAVVFRPPS